ncbi:MAG: tetratricopeptide repeat protein, partial [Rhodobacteraceae bacterium]|nr:tetratricopeptide repeat protein [Paracoccaceae bacterium]
MTDRTHPESDEIGGTRSRATGIDYVHLIQRGLECFTRGEIEAADASFKRATEKFPDGADGWANRSATLLMLDQTAFALECAERALALGAQSEPSGTNRALALMQLGRYRDAIAAHDEILARDRRRTDILVERGNASRALGEPENALTDYRKALAIDRDLLSALTNCGSVLLELGDAQGALLNYESALAVNAASADALTGKGAALAHLRRFDEAAACHRQALTLAPENAEAHNNLGGALLNLNRVDDALAAFDRAIQFKPGWPVPLANRGNALLLAKRYAEATETFGKVVALDESYDYALGDLMLSRIQNCDWSEYDYGKTRIDALVSRGIPAIKPLTTALLFDDPNLARRCAEIYTHRKIGTAESRRGINLPRTESERIRVAYVSADFREHAASYLLAGLFERHDRKNFEIFGIGCSPPENSSTRRRIVDACDTFVDASAWDDEKLRVFFRESRIDIVVDLTGHTRNGRTTLFALDTGAVHVNYLGYPGTMGHQAYDYIVSERYIVTHANRMVFTKPVLWL